MNAVIGATNTLGRNSEARASRRTKSSWFRNREAAMELSLKALKPALTKAQLAELLFGTDRLNKRESKDAIEAGFDLIENRA